jgi:hypothetical protein
MCSSIITKLRALRLLPPPANELVPLLFAIATFSCATLIFGHDHLQELWTTMIMIQSYPPENIFVFGTFAVYMTMYWGYSFIIHMAEHVIPALHHFKIQPEIKVTPWSEVLRMVPLVLFNQVGLGLPLLKVMFLILTWRRHGYGSPEAMAEFATQVPTIGRFVLTIALQQTIVSVDSQTTPFLQGTVLLGIGLRPSHRIHAEFVYGAFDWTIGNRCATNDMVDVDVDCDLFTSTRSFGVLVSVSSEGADA